MWTAGSAVGDVLEEGLAFEVFTGDASVSEKPSTYSFV